MWGHARAGQRSSTLPEAFRREALLRIRLRFPKGKKSQFESSSRQLKKQFAKTTMKVYFDAAVSKPKTDVHLLG
jgi:MoxR-like ATPase